MRNHSRFIFALLIGLVALTPLHAESGPPALDKLVPENVQDLRSIQERVKKVTAKVSSCVVSVRIGNAAGSGVIVSKDGYVLTAGHISGKPDRNVTITLPDGRRLKGKTLGSNAALDSGMIRITDEGEWPFVEMGDAAKLKEGAWCLALGHPEGYRKGRTPVLRLGRYLGHPRNSKFLRTDCALVGGDSGGPLFALDGKVIGIHSQIGPYMTWNLHVPVDTYRASWDRLVKGDVWGGSKTRGPYIGVELDEDCRIVNVEKDSPAEKAGLKADDVVIQFDKDRFEDLDDLLTLIGKRKPGEEVPIRVRRGKNILNLKVVIGKHPA